MSESKPSRAELREQKIRFVRQMLEKRSPISEVKRMFALKYTCSGRSAEPWVTEAFAQMRADVEIDVADQKAKSVGFYEGLLKKPGITVKEQIECQKQLDKIFGLHAAIKIDTTGNTTVTVAPTLSPAEERAAVNAVLNGGAAHATPATGN